MASHRSFARLSTTTLYSKSWYSLFLSLFGLGCATSTPATTVDREVYAPAKRIAPRTFKTPTPNPTSATEVTLTQLFAFAEEHAPAVAVAQSRVGSIDADILGAKAIVQENPHFGVGIGRRSTNSESGFDVEVSIQQTLEVAGERGLRLDAAHAERDVSQARVDEIRWAVHVEVHRLAVDLLMDDEHEQQTQAFVTSAEQLRTAVAQKVEAGESSPLILLVADADVAKAREVLVKAQGSKRATKHRLTAAVGWPTPDIPRLAEKLPPIKRAPEMSVLLQKMGQHHPHLRTRELAVVAAHQTARLEEREAWPEPTLRLGYGREAEPDTNSSADIWMFSLSIPVPLWNTNQKERAQALADLKRADKQREAAVHMLRSRLFEASSSLNSAVDGVQIYEETIMPNLAKNLKLLHEAYALGEVDILQVSQTRERLLQGAEHYWQARRRYYRAAAELEGFVGTELWSVIAP